MKKITTYQMTKEEGLRVGLYPSFDGCQKVIVEDHETFLKVKFEGSVYESKMIKNEKEIVVLRESIEDYLEIEIKYKEILK